MKLRLLGTAIVLILLASPFTSAEVFNCADGDVTCLANAISTANANGEDDTILLEEDGIYTLVVPDPLGGPDGPTGLPSITSVISLNGNGATIQRSTADSTSAFRILHVGDGGKLTLENTAIKNGISQSGGGIYSSSDLTVKDCIISNNVAEPGLTNEPGRGGGVSSGGHLIMLRCLVEDNRAIGGKGGGVSGHTVTVTGSTFARNRVVYVDPWWEAGGAIIGSYVEIMNSVLIYNSGTFPYTAEAVYAWDEFHITNSTVAFGGGIEANDDYRDSSLTNVTMAFNDGKSVGSYGGCGVKNSIFYGGDTLDCPDCGSGGNNVIDSRCDIELQSSDITDDPRLGSLRDSEVPGMAHFPLLSDSPAIDAGDDDACTPLDQLGNPRFDSDDNGSTVCDIGAIEFQGLDLVNEYATFEPDPSTYSFTQDTTGCPSGFVGKFGFEAQLTNSSQSTLSDLHVEVAELSNGNLLLTSNGTIGAGGVFPVPKEDGYSNGFLTSSEYVDVPFYVCLKDTSSFRFFVDVLGVVTPEQQAGIHAFDVFSLAGGGSSNQTEGYELIVLNEDINVTALGYYDEGGDGLGASHPVGLWTNDGQLLATVTVPSGTSAMIITPGDNPLGGYRYVFLSQPVVLNSNTTYVVAGLGVSQDFTVNGVRNLVTHPAVGVGESRLSFTQSGFTFPPLTSGGDQLHVNMLIQP